MITSYVVTYLAGVVHIIEIYSKFWHSAGSPHNSSREGLKEHTPQMIATHLPHFTYCCPHNGPLCQTAAIQGIQLVLCFHYIFLKKSLPLIFRGLGGAIPLDPGLLNTETSLLSKSVKNGTTGIPKSSTAAKLGIQFLSF